MFFQPTHSECIYLLGGKEDNLDEPFSLYSPSAGGTIGDSAQPGLICPFLRPSLGPSVPQSLGNFVRPSIRPSIPLSFHHTADWVFSRKRHRLNRFIWLLLQKTINHSLTHLTLTVIGLEEHLQITLIFAKIIEPICSACTLFPQNT
jgi:hypothetical protein